MFGSRSPASPSQSQRQIAACDCAWLCRVSLKTDCSADVGSGASDLGDAPYHRR